VTLEHLVPLVRPENLGRLERQKYRKFLEILGRQPPLGLLNLLEILERQQNPESLAIL
jgi:hypothetical protein